MGIVKQEKTVEKTVCIKNAHYAGDVFIPAQYKQVAEKITVYLVQDGAETHEFLSKEDAERFVK